MGDFRVHALEVPYRIPRPLDLKRLEDLISAKINELDDHIMALREDPIIF